MHNYEPGTVPQYLTSAQAELIRRVTETYIPFNRHLGIQLTQLEPGFAQLYLPFREEFLGNPQIRAMHGGLLATLLDAVGGAAAMTTLVSSNDSLSTIDFRTDYLRPGQDQALYGEAWIVRSGNRIVVTEMTVHHGDQGRPVAQGRGAYNVRRNPDQAAAHGPWGQGFVKE
jgi:uncharacterized protein (TIGR00369 family)